MDAIGPEKERKTHVHLHHVLDDLGLVLLLIVRWLYCANDARGRSLWDVRTGGWAGGGVGGDGL